MITSMDIKNFKCFKDFHIDLAPFNVLVGPNDTGKTAFLQAVRLMGEVGSNLESNLGWDSPGPRKVLGAAPWAEFVWRNEPARRVAIVANLDSPDAELPRAVLEVRTPEGGGGGLHSRYDETTMAHLRPKRDQFDRWFMRALGDLAYYRLDPSALRRPSLLSESLTEVGEGFPTFLRRMLGKNREAFFAMEHRFYERFPHYKRMELVDGLRGGAPVVFLTLGTSHEETLSPESVSDGVMLSLAFMAIAYQPEPPRVLLVEEPENGVHHASLKEIVATLKGLSEDKGVQVILTTHSPYLVDCVEPDVVQVFTKDDEGAVHARKLMDFKGAEEIGEMFSTGEKWSMLSEKYGI